LVRYVGMRPRGFYPRLAMVAGRPPRGVGTSRRISNRNRGYVRVGGFYGRFNGPRARAAGPAEQKFVDTAVVIPATAALAVPTTAATGQIVVIPQGDTQSQRIGRKCTIRSVHLKLTFDKAAGAVPEDDAHLYLVQDTQCNGAQAAINTLFVGTGPGTAQRNLENSSRFKVLKHWHIELESGAGVAAAFSQSIQQIDTFIKCNIVMEYDSSATTGVIATQRSNTLFLVYGSVNGVTAVGGSVRVKFTDV